MGHSPPKPASNTRPCHPDRSRSDSDGGVEGPCAEARGPEAFDPRFQNPAVERCRKFQSLHFFPISSLLEDGVEGGVGDGFGDLGFGAARGDPADGLAVYLDRQATLVGEEVGKGEDFEIPFLQGVGPIF